MASKSSAAAAAASTVSNENDDDEKGLEMPDETPEDRLWREILKNLEKLSKGVDGDLSALGRAVRGINRLRLRFSDVTWGRIIHTLIPVAYRDEFIGLVSEKYPDWPKIKAKTVAMLAGVDVDRATAVLSTHKENVMASILFIVKEKEKQAEDQLKKEKEEKEKLLREEMAALKQKGGSTKDYAALLEKMAKTKGGLNKTPALRPVAAKKQDSPSLSKLDADKDVKMTDKSGDPAKKEGKEGDKETSTTKKGEFTVNLLPNAFEDKNGDGKKTKKRRTSARTFNQETYVYLKLLFALELYDSKKYTESIQILDSLINFCKRENRRTCDLLLSRIYSVYSLSHQRLDQLISIRSKLFGEYQTACLQQNGPSQGTLINLILQSYLHMGEYALAKKFVLQATFPESSDTQQYARYHYYRGRIDVIRLDYRDALYHFQQSIRRAPQNGALGFKSIVTKWLIVVALLMGDIPERGLFSSIPDLVESEEDDDMDVAMKGTTESTEMQALSRAQSVESVFGSLMQHHQQCAEILEPYLAVTEAVRSGAINKFNRSLDDFGDIFERDGLNVVLLRLRRNVIRTGLRKINKSYSAISLDDIRKKLDLESAEDAYFIVSKAIRDGVIDAKIDYASGVVTNDLGISGNNRMNAKNGNGDGDGDGKDDDEYASNTPYEMLATRVRFCLDIHDTAVKALRYPHDSIEDEDGSKKKSKRDDDEGMTAEEIADKIRKQYEEDDE